MAIDVNATVKDYRIVLYNKTEIDSKLDAEKARVDAELALKSVKSDEGAPSGIATLNSLGKVSVSELPLSGVVESGDSTNNTTLITPERLQYQIGIKTISVDKVGVANGIAPLGTDNLVPQSFLPPAKNVQTFVTATLLDMYGLGTALTGDRCVVTSEANPDDNGEYVANRDYPVSIDGWDLLPNLSAVSSVNGQVGVVDITTIAESAANTAAIATLAGRVTVNEGALTTNAAAIALNTAKVSYTDSAVVAGHTATLASHTTSIGTNTSDISTHYAVLTALMAKMTYDYVKVANHTVTNDVYEQVARLTTPSRVAGVYKLDASMVYTMDTAVRSAYARISVDGGTTWLEVRQETSDVSDKIPLSYTQSIEHNVDGILDIIVQVRKEATGDIMELIALDLSLSWKRDL